MVIKNAMLMWFFFCIQSVISQSDTILISNKGSWEYSGTYSAYTSIFDASGSSYIYTASMELGLVVFDISDVQNPVPVDTVLPAQLGNLKLTNISQYNNYLFGSLGSFQGITQNAGLAIFNISDPNNVIVEDVWSDAAYTEGSAIAITDGQFAYLGAMTEGIVILDVSDVTAITFVSSILPDQNFPEIPGPFSVPNARGMVLKNADTLIVCNDAGGLRMIDVTDKFNPLEIGMYANSSIESVAQSAYNNVVLIGNYAYVPVDYCGLDVVDISTPVMTNVNWINPWGCTTTNWDGCAGHTNQIVNVGDTLLFISGGDSEILVYDISDKVNPVRIGEKIVLNNLEVSWGIDVRNQYIATAMVDNPFGIPYDSDWGGLQLWEWNETLLNNEEMRKGELVIFPNPADHKIFISNLTQGSFVVICDYSGRKIYEGIMEDDYINVFDFQSGLYFCTVYNGNASPQTCKFIIE